MCVVHPAVRISCSGVTCRCCWILGKKWSVFTVILVQRPDLSGCPGPDGPGDPLSTSQTDHCFTSQYVSFHSTRSLSFTPYTRLSLILIKVSLYVMLQLHEACFTMNYVVFHTMNPLSAGIMFCFTHMKMFNLHYVAFHTIEKYFTLRYVVFQPKRELFHYILCSASSIWTLFYLKICCVSLHINNVSLCVSGHMNTVSLYPLLFHVKRTPFHRPLCCVSGHKRAALHHHHPMFHQHMISSFSIM